MPEQARDQRVLVVEDEPLARERLQVALEEAGFHVVSATDASEAMAALEVEWAQDLKGLVTDVNLGNAATGWDIAKLARELNPYLPVVYVGGDGAHEWNSRGVPHSTMINKPFAGIQVVVALALHLNRTQTGG
jgi:DNA-binding response OmpR family regulator